MSGRAIASQREVISQLGAPLLLLTALLLALVLPLSWAFAQSPLPIPPLTGRVVDTAGVLTQSQKTALSGELEALEQAKGSQVAVLIVPTTQPEEIDQFAVRAQEAWKLGRAKVDDGVLLVVATEDRRVRIEVGYGLEGALTDAASSRIIREQITPAFRQGDIYGGIRAGVQAIAAILHGQELPEPLASSNSKESGYLPLLIAFIVIASAFRPSKSNARTVYALCTAIIVLVVATILASFLVAIVCAVISFIVMLASGGPGGIGGGYHYGGYSGRSGGGFSGGGFSGGGGRSGGGGASGSW